MQRYPHVIGFGILLAGLLVPLALRELSSRYEPYPAVLLPSGAYLVRVVEGRYDYQLRQLSA